MAFKWQGKDATVGGHADMDRQAEQQTEHAGDLHQGQFREYAKGAAKIRKTSWDSVKAILVPGGLQTGAAVNVLYLKINARCAPGGLGVAQGKG